MRRRTALGLALVQTLWLGCGRGPAGDGVGASEGTPAPTLTEAEREALRFVREEEKLARDVYMALEHYGKPFANIRHSEQSHMDAVLSLLERHGIDDPVEGMAVGELADPALQALYNGLVEKGLSSELAALQVGCEVEELDLRDLSASSADTDHPELLATYDSLLKGSRNHLRAYYGRLLGVGGSYTPQYITQAELDAIVSSRKE